MQKSFLVITLLFALLFTSCGGGESSNSSDKDSTSKSENEENTEEASGKTVAAENVFVMPIRKIKAGVSIEEFKEARDAYVALLEAEEGTLTDR